MKKLAKVAALLLWASTVSARAARLGQTSQAFGGVVFMGTKG